VVEGDEEPVPGVGRAGQRTLPLVGDGVFVEGPEDLVGEDLRVPPRQARTWSRATSRASAAQAIRTLTSAGWSLIRTILLDIGDIDGEASAKRRSGEPNSFSLGFPLPLPSRKEVRSAFPDAGSADGLWVK